MLLLWASGRCIWASARMSWVRSSVEAWYTTALEMKESLSGAVDSHVRLFVSLSPVM